MINLFNINNHVVNTADFENLLHGKIVTEFENAIAEYVGAKYAVSFNSATSAIFLALLGKNTTIDVPSMIPPVVLNAIITSGNKFNFIDNIEWIGDSYVLYKDKDYKIVDSAQKLKANQFVDECNDNDLMVFSFYPTKPVGSIDGGMIVSNDFEKINHLREMALNGMSFAENNWERKIKYPGYKMYMNSFQAKIAMNNFELYEQKLARLQEIRNFYNEKLNLHNTSDHLYRINVKNRSEVIAKLKNSGIMSGIHYNAMHTEQVYRNANLTLPRTDSETKTTLSIPYHENLTQLELKYITDVLFAME